MNQVITITVFFYFLSFYLFSYEIKNEIFMPIRYYMGDSVDFKFSLILSDDEKFLPIDFREIKNEFVEINSIRFNVATSEVMLNFVSFFVGSNTLPPIYIGDIISNKKSLKVVLKDIKINTDKLVSIDSDLKLKNIEGVLFVPDTNTYLFLFVLALFFIPYFFVKIYKFLRQGLIYFVAKRGLKKPYKILQKQFSIMSKYIKENESQIVIFNLINFSLRVYLSKKTGIDFNTITTTEISETLQDLKVPYEIRSTFISILRLADFSKFSGVNLVSDNLLSVLEDLRIATLNYEEFNGSSSSNANI